MRKWLVCLLAAVMLLGLVACGDDGDVSSSLVSQESEPTTTTTTETKEETTMTEKDNLTTTSGRRPTSATTTTRPPITDWEKPVTYNTAILFNEQHSSYDDEAEKMRLAIVNSKSEVGPSEVGNTYYISPKGDDANDGKSPATAWRTLENLHSPARFGVGDVVLFERGAVYRGYIHMASWVSYGAYGTGAKPTIYGGEQNYADPKLWKKTSKENILRLKVGIDTPDVGNIVFDHGKVCASVGKQFRNTLRGDFQFYHDQEEGYVYLYLAEGNPGERYDSIEVCVKKPIFGRLNGAQVSNITIDNLCLKYSGSFGIVFNTTENITVTNCEIGYIGGSEFNSKDKDGNVVYGRYGNGIEFNAHVTNALIKNNWIYQCYDAGYTNQGHGATHDNIVVTNNLIEYCNYNIELFASSSDPNVGVIKNCSYENNVLRFAGYGFGTINRVGSNDSVASNICYWYRFEPSENTYIRGNVFDAAYRYSLVAAYVNDQHERAPIVEGNTWIQHKDEEKPCAVALQVDTKVHGWHNFADHVLPAGDLAEMTASVSVIDKNPKKISFED